MYVRMLWGRLRHGMWDEYKKHYDGRMEPITQGIGELRGRELLQSTENPNEGMSITMWDTLEDLRNDESLARWGAWYGQRRA